MKYIFITTLFILLISGCSSSNKKNTVMKDDKPVVNKEKSETGTHSSDKTERKEFSKTKCVVENDVRYLKIVEMDPKGCELFYEKFSKEKSVAQSSYGTEHCEKILSKMKTNLETAGFTCQ